MRINHRQIEAFRAVFQTASMTAAGALLGITQPAVSRLIRDLEAETALTLFDRSAGKLTPTPDAVTLFREVQRSYQGLECLFVGSTSQSVRLRLQSSVELAPVPGSAIIDRDRHFNSIEARSWEPQSVLQRPLLVHGMRLPMLMPSSTKYWRNSRPWPKTAAGRYGRDQSRL
jgi:DNA-binding transcriptional LysR family regulator